MLPLRDTIHSYSFPIVNWILIGVNAFIFLFEVTLPEAAANRLLLNFGLVPARLNLDQPALLLQNPLPLFTLFSHMFLHGGWLHLLSNMWTLYIFGDNVEDRMGSGRYLLFYLLGGLAAGLLQAAINPDSNVPAIGASGAIAGVLGAYFLLYPHSRVISLVPFFFLPWFIEIPAIIYLGIWFISQLFSGLVSLGTVAAGGVAWWAHIGGFIFGMLFYRLFIPRLHPAFTRRYPDEYWPW